MTDEQVKGIARAISPYWWNDDIALLNFTRAVLAREAKTDLSELRHQKLILEIAVGELREQQRRDEALLQQALDALIGYGGVLRRDDTIAALKERLK